MKRRILIAIGVAAFIGGFHEWTVPAHAAASCTVTTQFSSTQVTNGNPPPDTWTVLTAPTLTASCSTKWYVVFTAQCAGPHIAYHQCITNQQCQTAPTCTPNLNGWGAGTTHSYDEPSGTPAGFTGYWNNGDGFTETGNVCDWTWRIREQFRNGFDQSLIKTTYSPEGFCIG